MKIIIEPKRSVIPTEYHTTEEYEFDVDTDGRENLIEVIESCIAKIDPIPTGMTGVSLPEYKEDFFITIQDGKMKPWR